MVADDVNQSWIPVREGIDLAHRFRLKKFFVAAGNLEAMINVITRLVFGQGVDVVTYGYSLPDGFVAFFVDHFVEFALADKKDIDELAVVHLDV